MRTLVLLPLLFAAACGGDDAPPPVCSEDGGEACFQLPDDPLAIEVGDPSIGCGAYTPTISAAAVTLSGTISKYSSGTIDGAMLAILDEDGEVATATSDADGVYTMTIPAGTPDELDGTITADGFLDVYLHNGRPDLSDDVVDFNLVTLDAELLGTLAALVDDSYDDETVAAAVVVHDCDLALLENAAVTVSATSGERDFVPGVSVYYGISGDTPVPARPEDQGDTAENGSVAIIDVPPGETVYLQAWGFPDAAAVEQGEAGLVLIAEEELQGSAGTAHEYLLYANQD